MDCRVGLRWNFRCGCPISKLRLVLDFSSVWQTRDIFRVFEEKKNDPWFFGEKSKTCLGFEIGQPQRKFQRKPIMQSLANPAVSPILTRKIGKNWGGQYVALLLLLTPTDAKSAKIAGPNSTNPIEVILDVFRSSQAAFMVGEPLCDLEISSWALKLSWDHLMP